MSWQNGFGKGYIVTDATVIDLDRLRHSCGQCSLHQLCLPYSMGVEDLMRLDQVVQRRRPMERGGALFRNGDPMSSLYVARDGAFKTCALSEDGNLQVIGFHLAGELIGLDALGSGRHRCDAEALTPATVCDIPYQELSRVAGELPALQRQLLRVIGRSIGRDQDHVEMMGRRHASERLALFLYSLSERYRMLGQHGHEFTLPMSREDIASYLGMVIETVSRTFSRLQGDGIIVVRGRLLRIVDSNRLNQLAHEPEALRLRG